MPLSFKIRQAEPYRTRIQFSIFRGQPACCNAAEKELARMDGVAMVQVRSKSGSLILVHPDRDISVRQVIELVNGLSLKLTGLMEGTGDSKSIKSGSEKDPQLCRSHVSGMTLLFSGLYLSFLLLRRAAAPIFSSAALIGGIISIPGLLTLYLARPIQRQAVENVKATGRVDMSLISTGLLYVSLFTGNILTALLVAWLYNLSGWMESRIQDHTGRLVRDMLTGKQTRVWKLVDGVQVQVDIADVVPGDVIVLGQGASIPVDGTVFSGTALVNEAAMTGESLPVVKLEGMPVMAGTLVEEGEIRVTVEKTGEQTRMAAIIRLIESARDDLGELGRTSLSISQAMVPVSLGLAAIVFLMSGSLFLAITSIMVTCPCVLRLSTSTGISTAMGNAAANGILIKGGSHVETAATVNTLALDKTGTLTESVSSVTDIDVMDRRYKPETILGFAAAALQPWNHPISRAVTRKAHEKGLDVPACESRKYFVGLGVKAQVAGTTGSRTVLAGSKKFMKDRGILKNGHGAGDNGPDDSGSLVFVACDGHLLGCIHASHMIRKDATPKTLDRLRKAGITHIALLTGDTRAGTTELARTLKFDEVKWGMSPEDKARWIEKRKADFPGSVVAMAGDGINDTPAFSRADLSFAVGEAGEDVTLAYAGIVLQQGGLSSLAWTLESSKNTLSVIKQSYAAAMGANALILSLMVTGIISPLAGALIHNLITLTAVVNAARPALSGSPALPPPP